MDPESQRFRQDDGTMPLARVTVMYEPRPPWRSFGIVTVRSVSLETYPGSLLGHDARYGAGAGEKVYGINDYLEELFVFGVAYDTRDHETVTTSGVFWDVSERCAPGGFGGEAFCGTNATFRGYVPLLGRRLSLAGRVLGDVLSQRATLRNVDAYGGLSSGAGLSGANGIRGVANGRYIGRTKVLANLEVRSFFLPFSFLSLRFELGAAAFSDVGGSFTLPSKPCPSSMAGDSVYAGGLAAVLGCSMAMRSSFGLTWRIHRSSRRRAAAYRRTWTSRP